MIRHGERADNVKYQELGVEVENMLDPPLTPLGFRQAEAIANQHQHVNSRNIAWDRGCVGCLETRVLH